MTVARSGPLLASSGRRVGEKALALVLVLLVLLVLVLLVLVVLVVLVMLVVLLVLRVLLLQSVAVVAVDVFLLSDCPAATAAVVVAVGFILRLAVVVVLRDDMRNCKSQ
jgi:hypothetical protein